MDVGAVSKFVCVGSWLGPVVMVWFGDAELTVSYAVAGVVHTSNVPTNVESFAYDAS